MTTYITNSRCARTFIEISWTFTRNRKLWGLCNVFFYVTVQLVLVKENFLNTCCKEPFWTWSFTSPRLSWNFMFCFCEPSQIFMIFFERNFHWTLLQEWLSFLFSSEINVCINLESHFLWNVKECFCTIDSNYQQWSSFIWKGFGSCLGPTRS